MRADRPVRVAIVCDYLEENWPSMDLVGEMVLSHLASDPAGAVEATRVVPPFRHRAARLPAFGKRGAARNADRLLNRFWDYPRYLRALARSGRFDLFHAVDHSYAQLVYALPKGRAVVTCHDLDTFRCLFDPAREPRPRWFRAMVARTLSGLRRAAFVACDSEATREGVTAHGIASPDRSRVVYLGIHPECGPDPDAEADAEAARLLGPVPNAEGAPPDLLHVGSNIPRKRVDVLLEVFAGVRRAYPGARLIKVGGALPGDLERRAEALGVRDSVVVLPFFSPRSSRDRATLAAVYRRADLVLQPSEAEGFGLPVAEALACGVPLLASDLPVLREVGGDAVTYRPVGDVPSWVAAALALLAERRGPGAAWATRRALGLERARRYTWSSHVAQLVAIYRDVLARSST